VLHGLKYCIIRRRGGGSERALDPYPGGLFPGYFFIIHMYLITTGHTLTSNLKVMVTGWEEMDEDEVKEIIVYSRKCRRGIVAAYTLELLGYTNVKYLDGGWKKWELTYPLEYEKNLDQMKHEEHADEGGC
jgi:rhodanese-related sulfurtransferase